MLTELTDTAALNAHAILRIAPDAPERLFSGDTATARAEYRRLAACWHPDRNPDPAAARVFAHIEALYRLALARLADGYWRQPGLLRLTAQDGRVHELAWRQRHGFELGELYLAADRLVFVLDPEHDDLYRNALAALPALPFASAAMREQMLPALPEIATAFETGERRVLVLRKTPRQVLLSDLLDHLGGRLEARHVAWIISGLLNLACYLDYAGLTHNGIGLDTCMVSPDDHRISLPGGWWYACPRGARMAALPPAALDIAPPDLLRGKRADARLDLESIRHLGRTLLGDATGMRLAHDRSIPAALADWLRLASPGTALHDYRHWQDTVLPDSFGPRRFVRLDVSASDIYPPVTPPEGV